MPGHNLLVEATIVGGTMIPVYAGACHLVDALTGNTGEDADHSKNWMFKIALAAFSYHLIAEGVGLNDYYLREGVAQRKAERGRTEAMESRRAERYNYSNYAVPLFPDKDVRQPREDPWAQGSWTGAPGAPASNAVETRE